MSELESKLSVAIMTDAEKLAVLKDRFSKDKIAYSCVEMLGTIYVDLTADQVDLLKKEGYVVTRNSSDSFQ